VKTTDSQTGLEIAVIGMAGRFPAADNIHEFWENQERGMESIAFFSQQELLEEGFDAETVQDPHYVRARGVVAGVEYFDAPFFNYTPLEAEAMDPQIRIFHQCAWEALEDAGVDPDTYPGRIGLYAGYTPNILWKVQHLLQRKGGSEQLERELLNSQFFSTLISYKLNLRGAAVTVHTACSTSLTAIHLACRGLLTGEADIAMAGGVAIALPPRSGYSYQPGMISSPDGHCRAFDERADGTNKGDGAAVVVLKRLVKAAAHRHHIYAVVKGSAINNDGNRKAGYTAPSVEAQAEVIRAALKMAEVEADTITYIETHGTGTPLGDSIEMAALRQAFTTAKSGFCRLGALKTNIGHLDAAAGAAGFIKAVLALKHRVIPPILHFNTPHREIDSDSSPFVFNRQRYEWGNTGPPRRAGVSAFGIGGTNAHVILEEVSPAASLHEGDTQGPAGTYQLIVLSARSETALRRMTENLRVYLQDHPHVPLADVAYTLQAGRRVFEYRKMLVCTGRDEAAAALGTADSNRMPQHFSRLTDRPVVFIFPGLGTQYVNMGRGLYERLPLFRRQMDRCFEILDPLMGGETKEMLYPRPGSGDQTGVAPPLLFALETALAQLLMQWEILPRAMMGYSFGEYTAAHLAGVFSLEHALGLLVSREKLIQKLPAGAMLSVPRPAGEVDPLLGEELSLAVDNGGSCIVGGTVEAVDAFEARMKKKRLLCVRLTVPHAIHSPMMDSILEEFETAVGRIPLNEPCIPYVSNVTGSWIQPSQVTTPRYWRDHMRQTARIADGLVQLLRIEDAAFIEVGPGVVLSTMVRQLIDREAAQPVVNLMRSPEQKLEDGAYLWGKIGRLWLYGKRIDWTAFHGGETVGRVPLPTYPFDQIPFPVSLSLSRMVSRPEAGVEERQRQGVKKKVRAGDGSTDESPRTRLEQIVADTWQEVLGINPIGIHDNFFDLGGDSLKGITLVNKFQDLLGEIIHITVLFDAPTIAELAVYFEKHYPHGCARLVGARSTGEPEAQAGVNAEKIARVRRLIAPLPFLEEEEGTKNPPALFVLSPPRTGSTLLRVILAAHPQLFAPPELNLLSFYTLKERAAALSGPAASHLQGSLRAIMQIKGCGLQTAQEIMARFETGDMTVRQFYRQLQDWINPRLLVDKTPPYTLNPETLKRAEIYFQDPLYIHLTRHPYGMIHSYVEARMDLLMGQHISEALNCSRLEMAELHWTIGVQNILNFLEDIPPERKFLLRFEDLVNHPEEKVRELCRFLQLEFQLDMLLPYKEKKQRMTDGVYSEGIMLGDMKFHRHTTINPVVADSWREHYREDFLGEPTREAAEMFGYRPIRGRQGRWPAGEDARQLLGQLEQFSDEQVDALLGEMLDNEGGDEGTSVPGEAPND
jgi:phthiocerol/phenolphthiocerol synthesis type-I polyketide synthase E